MLPTGRKSLQFQGMLGLAPVSDSRKVEWQLKAELALVVIVWELVLVTENLVVTTHRLLNSWLWRSHRSLTLWSLCLWS